MCCRGVTPTFGPGMFVSLYNDGIASFRRGPERFFRRRPDFLIAGGDGRPVLCRVFPVSVFVAEPVADRDNQRIRERPRYPV